MADIIDFQKYREKHTCTAVVSNTKEKEIPFSLPFGSILEGSMKDDLTNWAEPYPPKSAARKLSQRFDRLGPSHFLAIQEEFGDIPCEWRDMEMADIFFNEFVAKENTNPKEFLAEVVRRFRSELKEGKGSS